MDRTILSILFLTPPTYAHTYAFAYTLLYKLYYYIPIYDKLIWKITSLLFELLYMSRARIPGNKKGDFVFGYRQVCAYGFSKRSLQKFCEWNKKTPLEHQEDIELLRFLELGFKIKMIEMSQDSIPVDREEDLERVLNKIRNA